MNKPEFIDHIVLIVKDVQKTSDFYTNFLGKPEHLSQDSVSFKIGIIKIFFGLPYKNYGILDKDSGGINHLAFGVKNLEELKIFEKKLNKVNIKNSAVQIDKYGGKEFIWFDDPDGYRLEFYLRPDENNKKFLGWIELKEKLDSNKHKPPSIKEGEIWWVSLGQNIGRELNGKNNLFSRPMLVFKKLSRETFLGIPTTTQQRNGSWYVAITYGQYSVNVILSQVRVIDTKRLSTKLGQVDESDLMKIKDGFRKLYLP